MENKFKAISYLFVVFIIFMPVIVLAYYHPQMGRFMSQDPISTGPQVIFTSKGPRIIGVNSPIVPNPNSAPYLQYIDGMNLYQFTKSNPIMLVDPTGGCSGSPVPLPIPDYQNSIKCEGGELVTQIGSPTNVPAINQCIEEHEQQHVEDWIDFYGEDLCEGIEDRHLPVGGKGYDDMLKQSECDAYTKSHSCLQEALKNASCGSDKSEIEDEITHNEEMIDYYCN
jgi:hypothetical protein